MNRPNKEKFRVIGYIRGEPKMASHITNILRVNGIECLVEGSKAYGILVSPNNQVRATEILRQDAKKHKYWIRLVDG